MGIPEKKKRKHPIREPMRVQLEKVNRELATRVDELTRSQKLLAERERRLSAFIAALPNLSFILDEQGRYLEVMAIETSLLVAKPRELIGRLIEDVMSPKVGAMIVDAIQQTIEKGEIKVIEYKTPVLGGGEHWFEGRISCMEKDEDGHGKVVMIVTEITERVHLYQEILKRLSEFETFDKQTKKEGGVFISYSHTDKNVVRRIEEKFKKDDINYWLDEKDLLVGQVIDKAISRGIQQSWIFLIILSPSSIGSRWVAREFDEASYEEIEGNKIILPVICNDLKQEQIPARIRRKLYVNLSKDFETNYLSLRKSILYNLKEFRSTRKRIKAGLL